MYIFYPVNRCIFSYSNILIIAEIKQTKKRGTKTLKTKTQRNAKQKNNNK